MKVFFKKRVLPLFLCVVVVFTIFPIGLIVAAEEPSEVVPSNVYDLMPNLFSADLISSLKVNGVNVYLTAEAVDNPGDVCLYTTYTTKTVNVRSQLTVYDLCVLLGLSADQMTGNVVTVSESNIILRYGSTIYTATNGVITLPDNATLLASVIGFNSLADSSVLSLPYIFIGIPTGRLNINTWHMPGYESLNGYRNVMPTGVALSVADNLLSYATLTTVNDAGVPLYNVSYASFGKLYASYTVPSGSSYTYRLSLSQLVDLDGYEGDLVVSVHNPSDAYWYVNVPYSNSSYGYVVGAHETRRIFFDDEQQLLNSYVQFATAYSGQLYLQFPFIVLGYVWDEDSDGNAIGLNEDTWPVFSDYQAVPGFADIEYIPLTGASNLLTYEWFQTYLPSWIQMSTPSPGIYEMTCTDASKFGQQVNINMGTVGDLFRFANYTYQSGAFDLFTVHGLNFRSALGQSTFRFVDVTNNVPVVWYPSRDYMSTNVSNTSLTQFQVQWNLWISSNGVVTISFPYASPGHVFFRDNNAHYIPLSASTWPELGSAGDVPSDLTYADGYRDGYEAGLQAGSANGSYQDGYNAGLSIGHEQGYADGYNAGDAAGYDRGYLAGFEAGAAIDPGEGGGDYNSGFLAGYEAGRQIGYNQGFADGHREGYDEGYANGYTNGFSQGFDEGNGAINGATYNVMSSWSEILVYVTYHVETLEGHFRYTLSWSAFNNPIDIGYYNLKDEKGNLQTGGIVDYILWDIAPNYDGMNSEEPRYVESMSTYVMFGQNIQTDLYSYSFSFETDSDYMDRLDADNPRPNIWYIFSSDVVVNPDNVQYVDNGIFAMIDDSWKNAGVQEKIFSVQNHTAFRMIGMTIDASAVDYYHQGLNRGIKFKIFANANTQYYNDGYNAGYSVGNTLGYQSGKTEGLETGYNNGYIEGKVDGLGVSKTGDWKQLVYAVCEAPINVFQSLFNFEVLGLDMRAAFGTVLSLCVSFFLLKKVVF